MRKFHKQRLKVMAILVQKYHYMPLNLNQQNESDDIYLFNPHHPVIQVICLSVKDETNLIPIQITNQEENKPLSEIIIYFNKKKNNNDITFSLSHKDKLLNKYFPDIYNSFGEISLFSKTIIGICIIMFVLTMLVAYFSKYLASALIILGANYGTFIQAAHDYWRFFTAMFLHADIIHLFTNLISFYYLSQVLEKRNSNAFKWILFMSSIIGNMMLYFFNTSSLAVGLSAGLYGLLGWYLVIFIKEKHFRYQSVLSMFMRLFLINIFISFLPGISLMGHLAGFVSGLILSLIFEFKFENNLIFHLKVVSIISFLIISYFVIFKSAKIKQLYYLNDIEVINFYNKLHIPFYPQHLEKSLSNFYWEVSK